MKSNPVKSALRAGKFAFGTMVFEFFTPGMPQIAKTAGAEFVLFDMEHSGVTIETLKGQLAACRGIGITPMVRVPALQYHFIARCLDMGAMGIMVPMVEFGSPGAGDRLSDALSARGPARSGIRHGA